MQTSFHHLCGKPFGLSRGIEGAKASHQKVDKFYQALSSDEPKIARADLAAAAIGVHTKNFAALLNRAKTSAIQINLQRAAKAALSDRQAALKRKGMQFEHDQQQLESREARLKKQLDQLAEADQSLELARITARMEKERADDLAKKLRSHLRRVTDANVTVLPH